MSEQDALASLPSSSTSSETGSIGEEPDNEQRGVEEIRSMEEKLRYRRLQHLLEKSSIYSKFLLERMERQREEEERKSQRKPRSRKVAKPVSAEEAMSTEGGPNAEDASGDKRPVRRKRQASGAENAQDAPTSKRRKSAKEASYKMKDYVDSKGHLRKKEQSDNVDTFFSQDDDEMEPEDEPRIIDGQEASTRQPKLVTGGVLRPYQLDGMEWLKVLYENGVNGILGDEMGLGKTVQCIAFVAQLMQNGVKGPFLVVAPLSTLPNWVSEFKRFTPTLPVVLYHGTQEERDLLRRRHLSSRRKRPRVGSEEVDSMPVVVTSFEMCLRDRKYFQLQEWKYLIVDEGHRIKNLNCKLIKTLKTFNASNRLLLTGTPLQNNLSELWSLLNFLLPDIFDDLNCFQQYFDFTAVGDHSGNERILAQEREQSVLSTLHQILTPFLLRRLKTDVELKIPPKKEVLVYAPITPRQVELYKGILDQTILDIVGGVKEKAMMAKEKENGLPPESNGMVEDEDRRLPKRRCTKRTEQLMKVHADEELLTQIMAGEVHVNDVVPPEKKVKAQKNRSSVVNVSLLGKMMQLRKCVNHPYLIEFPLTPDGEYRVDEDLVKLSGKMMMLERMLTALLKDGHKVLIFSQMTTLLDIIEFFLEMKEIEYSRLDGSMSVAVRQEEVGLPTNTCPTVLIRRFNAEQDVSVFLLSTRAGGLGINLTAADTVIIYDSDWNPQADLQAQDRCHRIGQTKPVVVYRFVTANTIDQQVVEKACSKRKLEQMVIHKGLFKGHNKRSESMTVENLKTLLESSGHERVFDSGSTDVGISDEALAALLDRSFGTVCEAVVTPAAEEVVASKHSSLFKVVAEEEEGQPTLGSVNAAAEH